MTPGSGRKGHWPAGGLTAEGRLTGLSNPGQELGEPSCLRRLEGPGGARGAQVTLGRASSSPTYLSTDSTNTRSALMWTQAMKASLKFTLSQRSRGPCRDRRE